MAGPAGIRAVIVDSPSTDEFHDLARISGIPEIERKSAFHALNQKAGVRMTAKEMGISYKESNMVVAHLGGGITVGAHCQGKVIDSTIGVGEGPLTPERTGTLPFLTLPVSPSCPLLNYMVMVNVELEFTIQLSPIK